jgi:serine/threonine protein kinase
MEAIHLILEDHSGSVEDFVYGKADTGRAFVEMASYRVSKLMMRHTYLHKQFTLNESFEYRSKYCEVIIAEYHPLLDEDEDRFKEKNAFTLEMPDITSGKNASSKFHSSKGKQKLRSSETDIVALKFIKNRDSFLTERTIMNELAQLTMISQEQVTSKPSGGRYEDHFLRLFHSYDGDDKEDEDAKLFRRDSTRKNYADYPYCLVLEAARINLQSYFVYSDVLGNDWEEIERIITHVLSALQFLHNHGIVHGDLKPANIMITTDGRSKLIDLDASTMIGKPLGKRVSTAYCPPEMILEKPFPRAKLILSESSAIPQYNYLLAHPSYDLWSAGILFFYLASGGLPFAVNNYDCISSEAELINLFHWTDDYKSQKIQSVMNHIQSSLELSSSHLTSTTLIQVHNLLTLLLQKLPSKRPSIGQTLQHPFFTKKLQPRMAGHEATYDVFISYRVASDSKHAARLYRELTEVHGLRVWLDKYCLEAGKNWERAFCEGLIKSSAFVCLISRDGMFHSEHPNQNFVKLNPESSACDNCLLEWRLALEMQERGMLTGVFPLFVGKELPGQDIPLFNAEETQQSHGEVDIEQGTAESASIPIQFGNFFEQCKNYPYTPATLPLQPIDSVEKKINELLDHFGYVASYLSAQGASACSVKNVWTRIVSNQGAFIEGEYEAAVERVGKGIAEMIAHNRTGSQ